LWRPAVLREANSRPHAMHCLRWGGEFGGLGLLSHVFPLGGMASFPCKSPLLLLGVIGLAATLLEFEEGHAVFPI
jgi:hypothetical protein